jgi:hypothetical protein
MSSNAVYQHSKVFASLKVVKERIQGNLTTSQYLQAYDEYLEKAITPIIVHTKFFDSFLARLVGWQEKNFRRKVSFLNRHDFPSLAITFLLQNTPEGRLKAYRNLSLDRGICIEFIKLFHSNLDSYIKACNCELLNPGTGKFDISYALQVKLLMEESLKADTPLLNVYSESHFWLAKALDFKEIIVEKYTRLCLNTAKFDYEDYFKCQLQLDDIISVYLTAVSRAIDKCDSKQGVLTTYIKNWLKTGRTQAAKLLDKKSISVTTESLNQLADVQSINAEDDRTTEERIKQIRLLAKLADPLGAARVTLGIEEILSEKEFNLNL